MSEWVESFREDINALVKVVDTEAVPEDARKYAAAALNYLVTRMDLIPDWTETIGVVDDVLVLRTCVALAATYGLAENLEDADAIVAVGRLTNEADRIGDILGHDLAAKLRKHCARMTDTAVRGRTPAAIVADPELRAKLYEEIQHDLNRMPASSFKDADGVSARLKSYLHAKLKDL
ncbi:MAG TPA: DUF1232 domain-containing protein [Kofleriaceae bacterium]|nr:DUF1232 domain-containing protein [Kofleriaceae bacterium]